MKETAGVHPAASATVDAAAVAHLYLTRTMTIREIADELDTSTRQVETALKHVGVAMRRRGPRITAESRAAIDARRELVAKLYKRDGLTMTAIAERVGISVSHVHVDLKAAGVESRRSGPPSLHPDPGPLGCLYCGRPIRPKPSQVARGGGKYCSRSHNYKHRMRTGYGIAPELVANLPGHARRRLKLLWAPKPGRPRREVAPEQVSEVLRLHEKGFGYEAVAVKVGGGMTAWQVRQIVARERAS